MLYGYGLDFSEDAMCNLPITKGADDGIDLLPRLNDSKAGSEKIEPAISPDYSQKIGLE